MDTEIRNILSMLIGFYMNRELRSDFCIHKNKGVNQTVLTIHVISNFVLCCIDSTSPLFSTSKISNPFASSVAVQPGLFWVWSETLKTGLLMTRLIHVYGYRKIPKFSNIRKLWYNLPNIKKGQTLWYFSKRCKLNSKQ